jgi:hypothetical protein
MKTIFSGFILCIISTIVLIVRNNYRGVSSKFVNVQINCPTPTPSVFT